MFDDTPFFAQIGWIDGFRIIDVRMLNDYEGNCDWDYKVNIARVTYTLNAMFQWLYAAALDSQGQMP
jgi:hypothetical protein